MSVYTKQRLTVPHDSPAHAAFGSAPMAQAEKWNLSYRIALANAGIFLFFSLVLFLLEPMSSSVMLSAPTIFFFGSLLSFLLMVNSGGALAPVAWFVLGSGIFFGLGVVLGMIYPPESSGYFKAEDISNLKFAQINLLNAGSTFIVLAVAYPLVSMRGLVSAQESTALVGRDKILLNIFRIVVVIAALGVVSKFILFPMAENLLLRGMVAKMYIFIPCSFLLLGLLWWPMGLHLKLIASTIFLLEVLNGVLSLSKYQIITAMLALIIGVWIAKCSVIRTLTTTIALAGVFILINPLIGLGRAHIDYNSQTNSLVNRLSIITDVALISTPLISIPPASPLLNNTEPDVKKFTFNLEERSSWEVRLKDLARRFDVVHIQSFLVDEFDNGRAGHTMNHFWATMVPRVFWPNKPNMSRHGPELHQRYFNDPAQISSALAPTYSGEAYWNYGPLGVVFVSVFLGLAIGWLTRCAKRAMAGQDIGFFLIAFPVAMWAAYVESWVVATYLGEFIIFAVILFGARASLALLGSLK